MAHEIPISGHEGKEKTRQRVYEDFSGLQCSRTLKITVGVVGFARKLPKALERERH